MGSITHAKVSAIADDPAAVAAGEVVPSDWNDAHSFSLDKTDVGLGNVDNTSDANKPVSTATQTALDLKANLASPTFTGTPAAPTAAAATNTTQLATTAHVFAERTNAATLTNKTLASPAVTEYIEFNEATSLPTTPAADKVRMYIRDVNGLSALEAITSVGTRFRFLRDQLYFARNETGSTIPKGTPVYISGVFTGGDIVPVVTPARANATGTMSCDGITGTEILNNGYGRVYTDGRIEDIDTSAFSLGARLYVSASVAGAMTSTAPVHPNLPQQIARVTRSHASLGSIQVTLRGVGGDSQGTRQNTFTLGDAAAGAKILAFASSFTGNLQWTPSAARTLTLPDATDTLVGRATTDTLTNKTLTNPTVTNYVETVHSPAAGSSFTVDLANGTLHHYTTNANTTITLPAASNGKSYTVVVEYGGTHTVSWAGGTTIKWSGGAAPTATSVSGKYDIFVFTCVDSVTLGRSGGSNF